MGGSRSRVSLEANGSRIARRIRQGRDFRHGVCDQRECTPLRVSVREGGVLGDFGNDRGEDGPA